MPRTLSFDLDMGKYINADRLKAEIERKIHEISHPLKDGYEVQSIGKIEGLSELLEIIDSLQQEQPKVDLDFQVFAKEIDAVFNLPKDVTENTEENPLNWEYAIARHFYGLSNRALEEAAQHVYESWMGGSMDDVRRDMVELGRIINARKED